MECPKCSKPLRNVKYEAQLLTVDRCETCKGVWLDKGELGQYANSEKDIPDFEKNIQKLKPTRYSCPNCKEHRKNDKLFELPYTADSNETLFVDYCKSCEGIWLDAKEINSVQTILQKLRIQQKLKK